MYHSDQITEWFDPDEFDWQDCSWALATFCKYFEIWWDSDKFDWESSRNLAVYCYDYFDIWWDPNKFDWKDGSCLLAQWCSKYFNKWWDPDKFNWNYPSLFYLVDYCHKYFEKWWPNENRIIQFIRSGFTYYDDIAISLFNRLLKNVVIILKYGYQICCYIIEHYLQLYVI